MGTWTKDVARHRPGAELDEATTGDATGDWARLGRRLICPGNLYAGDTLTEAAWRVGVDASTVDRSADEWNVNGLDGLRPVFGASGRSSPGDSARLGRFSRRRPTTGARTDRRTGDW